MPPPSNLHRTAGEVAETAVKIRDFEEVAVMAPGPTPDPHSLRESRREREGLIRTLPRVYEGDVPRFPLSHPTPRERAVWEELWRKPQAAVWAELQLDRQVGMYVRTSVEAEEHGATAAVRSLLLRQESTLLLTDQSLLRAGYRISTAANQSPMTGAARSGGALSEVEAKRRAIPSSRGRLIGLPPLE